MMTTDKAQELFSAYFDGSLEPSLKRTLEVKFKAEPNLHEEYLAFVSLVADLDHLRDEDIEIPIFLSDRIATRLEAEQSKTPIFANSLSRWFKGLGFAALAGLAIFGAYNGFTALTSTAVGPVIVESANELDYTVNNGTVSVDFQPTSNRALIISTEASTRRIEPKGGRSTSPLINANPTPSSFRVQLEGDPHSTIIVVPGSKRQTVPTGNGTIEDYAKAIASYFSQPVRIDTNQTGASFSWSITGTEPLAATQDTLASHGYSADVRKGGLICILDR